MEETKTRWTKIVQHNFHIKNGIKSKNKKKVEKITRYIWQISAVKRLVENYLLLEFYINPAQHKNFYSILK